MLTRILILLAIAPAIVVAQYKWANYTYQYNTNCLLINDNYLWIGTTDAGLVCRNITSGKETVFDNDNGLSGDKIISIAKDKDATIWAATSKMILSHRDNTVKTHQIPDNQIVSLASDSCGNIWVACDKSIFKLTDGHLESIGAFDNLRSADEYPVNIDASIRDSSIYIRAGKRIFCFNLDGTCRKIINIPLSNPFNITIDNKGRLFVTNIDTVGVYKDSDWIFFTTKDKSLPAGVSNLFTSPEGDVWACGVGDVLSFINGNWKVIYKHEPGSGLITALAPLNSDSAWAGGNFLGYLTPDSLQVINANTPKNNIRFIYADKQGTIWVQAANGNIILYSNNTWDYVNFIFGSLGKNTVKMIQTKDGPHYFLQPRNVLSYGEKINGTVQKFIIGSGFIPSGVLNDLIEDCFGQIWFATTNGIIKNWDSTYFTSKNSGFASDNIKVFLLRKDSTLWAGGDKGALAFFKNNSWTARNLSAQYHITCLAEDSTGGLWIGTKEGLININNGKETLYTSTNGLGNSTVNSLLVDNNNRVWVGTYDGLSCFDNSAWTTFRRPLGIAGNFISSIVQNIDGTLWIGTDRGVSTLQINISKVKNEIRKETVHKKNDYTFIPLINKPTLRHIENCYQINGAKLPPSNNATNRAAKAYIVKYNQKD